MTLVRNPPPLWTCPACGHAFVTANLWHSCGRHDLDAHFRDRPPRVRAVFDVLRAAAESCGPVTVYAQKTRIVFQVRVRFAHVIVRNRWIDAGLWLRRRATHPRVLRIEDYGPRALVHRVRLESADEIDDALRALIAEAYVVGGQIDESERRGAE